MGSSRVRRDSTIPDRRAIESHPWQIVCRPPSMCAFGSSEKLMKFPKVGRPRRVDDTRTLIIRRTSYIVVCRIAGKTIRILRGLYGARCGHRRCIEDESLSKVAQIQTRYLESVRCLNYPPAQCSALFGRIGRGRNIQIEERSRVVRELRGVAVSVGCGILWTA
jgi:hypothetical protein